MKNYQKLFRSAIILLTLTILTPQLWAQSNSGTNEITMGIPELQLIASTNTSLNLELTTDVAGEAIESGAQDSSYVQVSSIIPTASTVRTIEASYDAIPAGTVLSLTTVAPTNGNQGGTIGSGLSDVALSSTAQSVITGIGSCYTGTAADDGYKLVYSWSASTGAYGDIVATVSQIVTVTLTLTAAQ